MPVIMKDNVQYAYTTKGTVFHTLSNAEYEALPESEKMNGDVYCIPDREPILNPDEVWAKIGTGTLDIGDDLTDGVNQLNSSLTVKNISTGIEGMSAYKYGRVVTMRYYNVVTKASAGWLNVGTLPDTLKPITSIESIAIDNDATSFSSTHYCNLRINNTGVVQIYLYSDKLSYSAIFTVTYISQN